MEYVYEMLGFDYLIQFQLFHSISKYKQVLFTEFRIGWTLWYMLSVFMVSKNDDSANLLHNNPYFIVIL